MTFAGDHLIEVSAKYKFISLFQQSRFTFPILATEYSSCLLFCYYHYYYHIIIIVIIIIIIIIIFIIIIIITIIINGKVCYARDKARCH